MNNRTADIANRTLAAPQDLTSAGSESWALWVAVGVCAVLLAVVVVFVFGLISRRHHKETLTAPMKETSSMPEQKRDAAASSEWWTRTQWALEATVSGNEVMNDYGLKMLRALAKSEVADLKEKAMLDAVWQGSSTRMQDDAVDQLIEDARELTNLSEAQKATPRSVDVDGKPESVRKTARTSRKTYDPTKRDQVRSILRREILAARLKVTLDQKLGRETSRSVKLLSELELPPLVRQVRGADDDRGDGRGPAASKE